MIRAPEVFFRGSFPFHISRFESEETISLTFNIDILHFAGLLKKYEIGLKKTFLLSAVMQAAGSLLLRAEINNTFPDRLTQADIDAVRTAIEQLKQSSANAVSAAESMG